MTRAAQRLLDEALRLSPTERIELAHTLLKSAVGSPSSDVRLRRARWQALETARGVVRLGGDAVLDCELLYDG